MSLQVRNPSTGLLERVAGFNDTDIALSPTSVNPVANKTIYAALAQKIDKTVNDLINYYKKSETYSQEEIRALIGAINTLTIEVVASLPTQDISTTTIYFVGPTSGKYDEYVYVNNAWVKLGDTEIDLSSYATKEYVATALQSYYTKTEIDTALDDYYDKDAVDDLLDLKQNTLDFDNTPIAGSQNPVTSAGIKTALDNILISGNGGSIIKVHHTAGAAAAGNTVTASKGDYSVSSTFDVSGDAIIIGFGEIGNITITCSNGSETGTTYIEIPCFSNYSAIISYGLDYVTWLVYAGIDPSYYHSLNEVFADEEAVRKLMTKHASVDYLATVDRVDDEMVVAILNNDICAKWINLRDYALDTLYANTYTKVIMDEADKYGYGEWAIVPLSQPMTDNTHPTGSLTYYNFPGFSGTYKDILYKGVNHYPSSTSEGLSQLIASQPWGAKSTADSYIIYTFPKKSRPVRLSYCTIAPNDVSSVINIDHSISIYGVLDGNETLLKDESIVVNTETQEASYIFSFDLDTDKEYDGIKLVFHGSNTFRPPSSYRDYNTLINYFVVYEWGPKGNVPKMTGYSAPYGTALASSEYNTQSFNAWRAFDQNPLDLWVTSSGATSGWVQYKFTNPICVKRFMIRQTASSSQLNQYSSVIIQGSNDGSTFTNIQTYTSGFPTTLSESKCFDVTNDEYYLYLRLSAVSQSNYVEMSEIQFYGREMKTSIPAMTSNTAPYGEAFASSVSSTSYPAWHAFNKDTTSSLPNWASSSSDTSAYLAYGFPYSVSIRKIVHQLRSNENEATWKIQYSDDKQTWYDTTEDSTYTTITGQIVNININDNGSHKYWRIQGISKTGSGTTYFYATELYFFGFDYSERDWDTEHPMKYIYDHGVELDEFIVNVTNASNASVTKTPNQLLYKTSAVTYTIAQTYKNIDLSDYDLVCINTGDSLYNSGGNTGANIFGTIAVSNAILDGNYSGTLVNVGFNTDTGLPYKISADISNINEAKYLSISTGNKTAGQTRTMTINEWWLE